jgi:putative thioredoxin
MGSSIAINQENFNTEVLQASHQKPVLVDFFAQWCGPCQMLKPMLETLAQEYDFVLAKVDIDQNPELAQTYGVQGVPDVRIVVDGEVNEGFVGVLPEPQLRQLMAQLNLKSALEIALETIYQQAAIGQRESAQALLNELVERHPQDRRLALEAANFYLEADQLDSAETLLASIQEYNKEYFSQAKKLKALIFFKQITKQSEITQALDETWQKAAHAVLAQDYSTALESCLTILQKGRAYRKDGGRKVMLAIFDLLGDDHPLTKDYRKKLMMVLY